MTQPNTFTQQEHAAPQKSNRRMHLGLSGAVIIIALIIIFMPKKTAQDTSSVSAAPMFKKEGVCTITDRENKPKVSLDIEIADNDKRREIGMMGRPTMEEHQGMFFVFQEEYAASFWMKNTILPLDIIFINKLGEIITICKNTTPFSEQSYSSTGLTLFVLEVNAGFTDTYNIKEGDRIIWKRVP